MNVNNNFRWVKLGNYIDRSMVNNKNLQYGVELIEGVNSSGEFCPPKANTVGINLKPYKVVQNGYFVYNPSRLNIGSLAFRTNGLCIVSHLYVVFHLNELGQEKLLPEFLFLYFKRKEFLRLIDYLNFGSQRPEFNFFDMSEIKIPLPDIDTQQELVDTYNGLKALAEQNEALIKPLTEASQAYIADCKKKYDEVALGVVITQRREKFDGSESLPIRGVSKDGFIPPKQKDADLSKYNVFYKYDFVFNPARMELNSIALNIELKKGICSSLYEVFSVDESIVLAEFLNLFIKRSEFARQCEYIGSGSAREYCRVANISEIKFPLPPRDVQQAIINIYNCAKEAKKTAIEAREKMKMLCPALVQKAING